MMDIYIYVRCHCPDSECAILRVNSEVYYGFWMIMMCQCGFILNLKKICAILVMILRMEEATLLWGPGALWEISVPSSQFYCKTETALKP